MSIIRIAHISDFHLPPLPRFAWSEISLKKMTGWLNWHRSRRKSVSREILDILLADLTLQRADHVIVTGDLVNLALRAEIEEATKWLAKIGPPSHVSLVPGNHDCYEASAKAIYEECWRGYMLSDRQRSDGENDKHLQFPYQRNIGKLAMIGVSTACPCPPFFANGRIGQSQLEQISHRLRQASAERCFRLIFMHHPPAEEAVRPRHGLDDRHQFRDIIAASGAELILHGHIHLTSHLAIPGPGGPVPVIGAGLASAVPNGHYQPASYNLFSISRRDDEWICEWEIRRIDDQGTGMISDMKGPVTIPQGNS